MIRDAVISPCGRYRYSLVRQWDTAKPRLIVCMLNPSSADTERDDPTILALIHFARTWGYGGFQVINLHAFRTSRPADLFHAQERGIDTFGPSNWTWWMNARCYALAAGSPLLVAWGNHPAPVDQVRFLSHFVQVPWICLGLTKYGAPIHPAARGKHRIPRDQQPIPYKHEAFP